MGRAWEHRLRCKLDSLRYALLEDFLAHHSGVGYVKLAEMLGDANVAAMQIYGKQIQSAILNDQLREAAKDCLVRFLNEYVVRGWGVGRHFHHRLASACAAWSTTIKAHASNGGQIERYLKAVIDRLEAATPPKGWRPMGVNDAIVGKIFEDAWPIV